MPALPAGWDFSNHGECRSCHTKVTWATRMTATGQTRAPFNDDGTSHFATCPQAADWRRP